MSKWMNLTVKSFVVATVLCFCSSMVMAAPADSNKPNRQNRQGQQGKDRQAAMKERVEQRLKELTTGLNLNENQQKSVRIILQSQAKQMEALMAGLQSLPQEERRAKMQENRGKMEEIHKNTNQKIEQLLNADQKEKFKKMVADEAKQRQERQGQRGQGQHRRGQRGQGQQGQQGQPGQGQQEQGNNNTGNQDSSAGSQPASDSGND